MAVGRWMPWLIGLAAANAAVLVVLAAVGWLKGVAFGAAFLTGCVTCVAVALNRHYWHSDSVSQALLDDALVANIRVGAVAWLWGALAMQGVYLTSVTGLKWQHAWQYASAMLLIAAAAHWLAGYFTYGRADQRARRTALDLVPVSAALQAIGGAFGTMFLVTTGKAFTWRPDWAANQIFLFGALLVTVLGAITVHTHRQLKRRLAAAGEG